MGQTPYFDVGGIFQAGLVRADDRGDPGLSGTGHGGPDVFLPRKRQIKGRVDRYEKIVVERIEMFHHY